MLCFINLDLLIECSLKTGCVWIWTSISNLAVKNYFQGLPWWRSGWESACQCRGHGFEPWSGRVPHAAEQLGPWATIAEPARLEPVLRNKRGRDSERPAHRDEEWPPLAATRESPRTETKTQHSHKWINLKKNYFQKIWKTKWCARFSSSVLKIIKSRFRKGMAFSCRQFFPVIIKINREQF